MVTAAVIYVGQVAVAPTSAPCPLFETVSPLIASMLLALLWLYYGNGEMSRGVCGYRCITSFTTRVGDLLATALSTVCGSVRLHHSRKEPPLVCLRDSEDPVDLYQYVCVWAHACAC